MLVRSFITRSFKPPFEPVVGPVSKLLSPGIVLDEAHLDQFWEVDVVESHLDAVPAWEFTRLIGLLLSDVAHKFINRDLVIRSIGKVVEYRPSLGVCQDIKRRIK